MEVKKIVEGMTAPEVAQVIDENFNALNGEKATVEAVEDVQRRVNVCNDNTGVSSYPVFDASESVEVGSVRRYEGLMYRAKEAGAHDWDPEKWERVTLKQLEDEKLSELGSNLESYKISNSKTIEGLDARVISIEDKIESNVGGGDTNNTEGVETIENGFYIVDNNGNIGLKYDKSGFQVVKAKPMPSVMIETEPYILIIGNSFSVDVSVYLPKLLESNDIKFTIGIVDYPGKGLNDHISALSNNASLDYYEYDSEIGKWISVGKLSTKTVLNRTEWNAIFLHEVSGNSTSWTTIKTDLGSLIDKLKNEISYDVSFGYILTAAYGINSSGYSDDMWNGINLVGKNLMSWDDIKMLIPIHTGIENARTNVILQSYGDDLMASSTDRHIEDGVGRYIESCVFYTYIRQFYGLYKDVREGEFVPTYGENVSGSGETYFPQTSSFAAISEDAKRLAIKSALMAVARPFEITKIK